MSPSEYLDEAVWILGSGDALQPQLRYLPPILADVALHLPDALLQRHGSFNLQKTELGLQPGDACSVVAASNLPDATWICDIG